MPYSLDDRFDGWLPIGSGIVTSKLIKDPQSLRIWTKLNGKTMQDSTTKDMIFSVAKTISFLSQGTTLLPGDIISTGTYVRRSIPKIYIITYQLISPQGVGSGRQPSIWLRDGDIVEVGLEGIGTITNKVEYVKGKPKL